MVALANQRVRVYRLYTQIGNQDVRRMQICINEQLVIEDSCVRAVENGRFPGPFEINVWPARFALFEAVRPTPWVLGEMVRVPQEEENDRFPTEESFLSSTRLEMPTPSYSTWD